MAAEQQRLTLLFRQAPAASVAAAISAVACAMFFLHAAPGPTPLAWLSLLIFTTLLRLGLFYFNDDPERRPATYWLRRHGWTALAAGAAWGTIPLIQLDSAPDYLQQLQMVVPAFVLMAAITSYGVCFSQYLAFWSATSAMTIGTRLCT